MNRILLLLHITVIAGCVQSGRSACESMNGMSVYCGFKNPEDLVIVPTGEALIVSEMGQFMRDNPGRLSMLELSSGERQELDIDWTEADQNWGEEQCGKPDIAAFSPHGIDISTRSDGRYQLLVVNHGNREAVEFFEPLKSEGHWSLAWRGCALPPDDSYTNDVAALADGGFVVTHMFLKSMPFEKVIERFTNGENIGWVWEWQQERGFSKLAGSDLVIPNGIAVNSDNSKIFINDYLGNKTVRLDRASGQIDGSVEVLLPDNVTVDEEGYLWVASHQHDVLAENCDAVTTGPCLLPFEVVKVDPVTMQAEVLFAQDGPPIGYATVALKVGGQVFMGSAHGDRVVSRPYHLAPSEKPVSP